MSITTIFWIVCGIVWGVVIFGALGLAVFNRIRNRDKHGEQWSEQK